MRDRDIRTALREELKKKYAQEEDTIIVDELGLCNGSARIDIAVINGSINGYEIKSEKDTLVRLPGQQAIYNKVFDSITIVINTCHVNKVIEQIPSWWGITTVDKNGTKIEFKVIREPKLNRVVDNEALVRLLWRSEILEILIEKGMAENLTSKPRKILWRRLAESLPLPELNELVRSRLKTRTSWRVDQSPKLNGDLCPLSSK
jgi:hypothetical protein